MEYIIWYILALLFGGVGWLVVALLLVGSVTTNIWLIVVGITIWVLFSDG